MESGLRKLYYNIDRDDISFPFQNGGFTQRGSDRFSRELDQWIKKMKCSGATGTRLENFRDIKVGIIYHALFALAML